MKAAVIILIISSTMVARLHAQCPAPAEPTDGGAYVGGPCDGADSTVCTSPVPVGGICCVTCDDGFIKSVAQITCQTGNTFDATPTCTGCTDNTVPDTAGTMCEECPDGQAAMEDHSACEVCSRPISNCEECERGQGGVTCSSCADGYALKADGSACDDCSTAAFTDCDLCERGDDGAVTCDSCASGMVINAASTACEACTAAGSDDKCNQCENDACTDCQSGYVLNDSNLCTACTAAENDAECSACDNNHCTGCNSGFKLNGSGASATCEAVDDDNGTGSVRTSAFAMLCASLLCLLGF